jgi:hypothetical protein
VNVDTLSKFKFELKKIDETENHSVPKHFFLWSSKIKYYFNSAKKFSFNIVLACMYIGQSKKKCFKFSRAAPHRQDGSDTIPTRNK